MSMAVVASLNTLFGVLALTALTSALTNTVRAAEPGKPSADSADARRESLMKNCLSHPSKGEARMVNAVPFAISAYWLNEHLPEADAATIRAASPELAIVAFITLVAKPLLVPALIVRLLAPALRAKREVQATINVPATLALALAISLLAYFLTRPLVAGVDPVVQVNVPIGLDVLLLGVVMLAIRREAVPQLMSLMVIDNGAFFAGIAIAHDLTMLVELAIATDGLIIVFIMAVLVRALAQHVGATAVGELATLREGAAPPVAGERR